jgi:DNA-binding beta-propeller fold protein YncE
VRRLWAALALPLWACGPEPEPACHERAGAICAFAGTGYPGLGAEGEPRLDSPLYLPQDVAVGPDGRVWLVDWNNHRVRVVEADGRVFTALGSGQPGNAVDGPAREVLLERPTHVGFDGQGRAVLSAWGNARVMRLEESSGRLETIAGTGKRSFSGDGGPALLATVDLPVSTALGPDGSLYVADQGNLRVRRVDTAGLISTVAGSGEEGFGGDGGPATEARLQGPVGQGAWPSGKIAVDGAGNLYIADSGNQRVRRVTPEGRIDTVAGSGEEVGEIGEGVPALQARLARPTEVAVGPEGSLYLAHTDHSCVRRLDAQGRIHTVAGVCGEAGNSGEGGPATSALLSRPFGIDVGPDGTLYIADTFNHRVLTVRP